MNEKKQERRPTSIDADIRTAIEQLAESERRSFAGQVNYLLRWALKFEQQKAE